jgi:hypothetical protein
MFENVGDNPERGDMSVTQTSVHLPYWVSFQKHVLLVSKI